VPTIRARYKAQRDAMRAALERTCRAAATGRAGGGMFFWVELPEARRDGAAAAGGRAGMAFVPAPRSTPTPRANTLRLSFVTVPPERIEQGVARWRRP
jgi:2-aminoadipate transaminase